MFRGNWWVAELFLVENIAFFRPYQDWKGWSVLIIFCFCIYLHMCAYMFKCMCLHVCRFTYVCVHACACVVDWGYIFSIFFNFFASCVLRQSFTEPELTTLSRLMGKRTWQSPCLHILRGCCRITVDCTQALFDGLAALYSLSHPWSSQLLSERTVTKSPLLTLIIFCASLFLVI